MRLRQQSGRLGWVCLGKMAYNVDDAAHHVQELSLAGYYGAPPFRIDQAVVRVLDNHGAAYTCLYQIKLEGWVGGDGEEVQHRVGRAAERHDHADAVLVESLRVVGVLHGLVRRLEELVDDGGGRTLWHVHALPRAEVELRIAGFDHRRHIGKRRHARFRDHGKNLDLSGFGMRHE